MKINGLRWWILSLIVLVTIINYLDRNTLAIMWQGIVGDLGLIPKNLSPEENIPKNRKNSTRIFTCFSWWLTVSAKCFQENCMIKSVRAKALLFR